jgi:hydrogenase maturation protein HypF
VLTQHLGDLEEARTAREYARTLGLYLDLFAHRPERCAVDLHPDYRSTQTGRAHAAEVGLALETVQHHHAHIAAVLADNGWARDAGPVLGIALDGLGYGADGTLWGGELLVADYRGFERAGWLRPVPLPGGVRAILEPWRCLFAQLETALGFEAVARRWPGLAVIRGLGARPVGTLRTLMERGLNAPRCSSAGRLFDAVAAALGLGGEVISYEGQAAIELEALAACAPEDSGPEYPFARTTDDGGVVLDPAPLWPALLDDLAAGVAGAVIARRFHLGFCEALAVLGFEIARGRGLDTVALSGGVLQNRLVLEGLSGRLRGLGLTVLLHRQVPSNDGGLSLGQAVVAAARGLQEASAAGDAAPKRSSR